MPTKSGASNSVRVDPAIVSDAVIDALVAGRHGDAFAVLGMHATGDAVVLRAFVPGAEAVTGIAEGDLNTDAAVCGGSNVGSAGAVDARPVPWRGQEASMEITIPPLATIWFVSDEAARTTRIRQR